MVGAIVSVSLLISGVVLAVGTMRASRKMSGVKDRRVLSLMFCVATAFVVLGFFVLFWLY